MPREWTWVVAVALALALGAVSSEGYARLMTPYYRVATQAIASLHPWRVVEIAVKQDKDSHSVVLRLTGAVRQNRGDVQPAAIVVSSVQVGEVIETPLVFWTLLLMWPAQSMRSRAWRTVVGIPVFLLLEAITTGCQLVHPLAEASAMLAGERDPLTLWERWSRLLEAGGRFGVEVTAALLTVAMSACRKRSSERLNAMAA